MKTAVIILGALVATALAGKDYVFLLHYIVLISRMTKLHSNVKICNKMHDQDQTPQTAMSDRGLRYLHQIQEILKKNKTYEPRHEDSQSICEHQGLDQSPHSCSLIKAFAVRKYKVGVLRNLQTKMKAPGRLHRFTD